MKRTLIYGSIPILLLVILAVPIAAQTDYVISPDPVVLTVCHDGGIAKGTFTITSYYPQGVEVGVHDFAGIPYKDPILPILDNGWVLEYGDSVTVTVVSTAVDPSGTRWNPGTYTGWLGLSIDDALTNVNLDNPTENVEINIVECQDSPEFPGFILPVTMILGVLGTVLYLRRTREN